MFQRAKIILFSRTLTKKRRILCFYGKKAYLCAMNWKILSILLALFLTGCIIDDHEEPASSDESSLVGVGDRLPVFSVEVTDGEKTWRFSSSSLTGTTVIVFFNTTCRDCQRELPELNAYYLAHRSEAGFQMVAISREEGAESVAAYWAANGLLIPYSAQTDRRIYSLFATSVIPRIYFCGADGIVTRVYIEKFF